MTPAPEPQPAVEWEQYIERVPGVCGGCPVIKGTRWAIDIMVKMIAGGADMVYLLREFPQLKEVHWKAALNYAAEA